jgi:hypothetical protein
MFCFILLPPSFLVMRLLLGINVSLNQCCIAYKIVFCYGKFYTLLEHTNHEFSFT